MKGFIVTTGDASLAPDSAVVLFQKCQGDVPGLLCSIRDIGLAMVIGKSMAGIEYTDGSVWQGIRDRLDDLFGCVVVSVAEVKQHRAAWSLWIGRQMFF